MNSVKYFAMKLHNKSKINSETDNYIKRFKVDSNLFLVACVFEIYLLKNHFILLQFKLNCKLIIILKLNNTSFIFS